MIEVFIEELDLAALGFAGMTPAPTGRPAYHPSTLLKICLYGYVNRVQSSRRQERESQRNIELMWLVGRLAPDFKTIADFRRDILLHHLQGPHLPARAGNLLVQPGRLGLGARYKGAIRLIYQKGRRPGAAHMRNKVMEFSNEIGESIGKPTDELGRGDDIELYYRRFEPLLVVPCRFTS